MALHRDLTGDELHEPKGIDTASENSVYVANGAGSGTWKDRFDGHYIANEYTLTGRITDLSTAGSRYYFTPPVRSELISLHAILDGALGGADSTLQIYINGVLFPDSLTIESTGSSNGNIFSVYMTAANTLEPGSLIEVRTDGASDNAVAGYIQLGLRAKA